MEFERLSNASGPTGGKIVLRDGKTTPKSVGIIHCVGSRDKNYNNYCSSICCMQSLKFAHLVHEKTGATVYNFYIDIRTPGKGYDEFYQRLIDEGTLFVRGKVAEVTDAARNPGEEGKLIVQVEDTLVGKQRRIPVDMVILSAGLEPRSDAKELAKTFGISCSRGRLVHRAPSQAGPGGHHDRRRLHRRLRPGPQGHPCQRGTGSRCRSPHPGQDPAEGNRPGAHARQHRSRSRCSGCRICNSLCPFSAILFHEDKMVSEINPALCQGCGTCVAACPAGAISGTGFSNEQILSQIDGLLLLNVPKKEALA